MGLICCKNSLKTGDYLGPGGKSLTGAFLANIGEIHSSFVYGMEDKPQTQTNECSKPDIQNHDDTAITINHTSQHRFHRSLQRLNSSNMPPIEV